MFAATNGLLMLVGAGMAATAAHFLVQADLLPTLGAPLWDTSFLVSNGSLAGKTLHALIGYDAQPCGSQMLFFAASLAALAIGTRLVAKADRAARKPAHGLHKPQPT
jgi:high-affinity iron transporter